MEFKCPVCTTHLLREPDAHSVSTDFSCPNCGRFRLTSSASVVVEGKTERNLEARAILSHSIQKMQRLDRRPELHSVMVKNILKNNKLSTPAEQADNLILWLGDNTEDPGIEKVISAKTHQAIIGAISHANVEYVLKSLFQEKLIEAIQTLDQDTPARLSFLGWKRYEELKRSISDSRKAFMAMEYGDPELDKIVDNYFRHAVSLTGFELIRLNDPDRQKAGLIDNRMRVEIRTSRFLIADLTHDNEGAYWEAGFAEGLGKPVIYTCSEKVFAKKKTHFDTEHHFTIRWDKDDPSKAAEELKVTIRATMPDEAKLEDDPGET